MGVSKFRFHNGDHIVIPPVPVELAGRYRRYPYWHNLAGAIYLMTSRGLSTSWDILWMMKLTRASSEATRMTLWQPLVTEGFAEYIATVPLPTSGSKHFATIAIYQPTPLAYDMANACGWKIAPKTDWQCLATEGPQDAQQLKHSAAVLAAAHHLRRRELDPHILFASPGEPAPADISFTDPVMRKTIYLDIEIAIRNYPLISLFDTERVEPRENTGFHFSRWERGVAHQGYAAVCTLTPGQRHRLVSILHQHRHIVSATDLATLAARTSFSGGFPHRPFFVQDRLAPLDHQLHWGRSPRMYLYSYYFPNYYEEPYRPDNPC